MTAKSAAILFFSGVASFLCLVLAAYAVAYAADTISCFNVSQYILTPEELEERRTASSLTRQSGLAGILSSERVQIFRTFFEKRSYPYHKKKKVEDDDDDDIEAQKKDSDRKDEPIKTDTQSTGKNLDETTEKKTKYSETANETKAEDQNSEDLNETCAICLNEYDDGDKVMTGTSCTHMFHYDCCMQWTEKGVDHCPYCRENMMTASELFEAAKEELGDQRVDKLKKINEEAAARIAAFEAARRAGQATNLSDIPAASRSPPSTAEPASGQPSGSGESPSENIEDVISGDSVQATATSPVAAQETSSGMAPDAGEASTEPNDAENEGV